MTDTDPINELNGNITESGWTIGQIVKRRPEQTGGFHSVGYDASHPKFGQGFLKAIDFSKALESDDVARALQDLTSEYNFERDLAEALTTKAGLRIVRCLDHGAIKAVNAAGGRVLYLIFERADGDLRTHVLDQSLSFSGRMQILHSIFLCVAELHKNSVSHQDIKPSNFLTFLLNNATKIGDFGRSWSAAHQSRFDSRAVPCQPIHAPIDRMYRRGETFSETERYLSDLYGLGAIASWLLAEVPLTPSLVHLLDDRHKPLDFEIRHGWRGFFKDVMPYLDGAHSTLMIDLERAAMKRWPPEVHMVIKELVRDIRALTHPDPMQRGDRKARLAKNRSSADLQPFISRLDRLRAASKVAERAK